jgi:hypothetical protein
MTARIGAAVMDTWLVRACRARSIRQLGACGLVVAAGLLLALASARYVRNFVAGPYPLSAGDLAAISDVKTAPRYFVHVEGTRTIDTGVELYEIEKRYGKEVRRSLKARYFALELGPRLLVVKTAGSPSSSVEGALAPIPLDLDQHLFNTPEMRTLRSRFYPYYLDTASFRSGGYWALGIGAVVLVFLGMTAARAWKRLQDPARHPLVERAASWGDPVSVAVEVEREHAQPWRRSGTIGITDHYLVNSSFFGFDVLRLTDLLWAYKRVTKKSVNFVPVGKDYHAVLACVGGTVAVRAKDAEVDEILRYVEARAPWAVFGHSKEIEDAFKKDPGGFVVAVAERRRRYEATSPPA